MHVVGIADGRSRLARLVGAVGIVGAVSVGVVGCGSTPPAGTALDPALAAYCETFARVRAEQSAPGAGQGGVAVASAATRRQLADLVRTAPPEIAGDWRTVQQLTERSLASLAATGGDAQRIDRATLERLQRASDPAVARIMTVTEQRC